MDTFWKIIKFTAYASIGALILLIFLLVVDVSFSQPPAGAWQGCENSNSGITLADVYNAGFFHKDSSDTIKGKPVFTDTVFLDGDLVHSNTYPWIKGSADDYWHLGTTDGMKQMYLTVTRKLVLTKGADIASAATITITNGIVHDITGTADIDSIVYGAGGQIIILQFDGTAATNGLVDGKNLKLAGDFAYTPDDVIQLYSDGSDWFEISRSVN